MKHALGTMTAILLAGITAGCAGHYYKVTDPTTGKEFYTQEVTRHGAAVEFKDARTGASTGLQNSQVLEIKKDAFTAGIKAPPAAAAAAAATSAAPSATPVSAPAAPEMK